MKDKETRNNIGIVKDLFAAFGQGDEQGLLTLAAEDIEWITPGEDWSVRGAGTLDYWI